MNRYRLNQPEVIAERFDNEYVIVNLENGAYYAIANTGAAIWEQITLGATHAENALYLTEQFSADDETIANALDSFIEQLKEEDIIVVETKASSNSFRTASAPPTVPAPFVIPVLEKHTDMREVLQLDPIHEVDDSGWPSHKA